MKVKDLIKSPVTTCTTSADVGEVRDLMSVKKFSAMPVVELDEDKATLKGIVSYHDLAGVQDDDINVQQVMTYTVNVIDYDATINEAARIMMDKHIHHLVVMREGQIAGIISSFDFVRVVAEEIELNVA